MTAACYIRRMAPHHALTVADVVQHVGIPRRTLVRNFTLAIGHSPKAEILRIRIQRAQQLVRNTSMPIHHIAAEMNFNSPEEFSRFFQIHLGVSASQYRQSAQHSLPWKKNTTHGEKYDL